MTPCAIADAAVLYDRLRRHPEIARTVEQLRALPGVATWPATRLADAQDVLVATDGIREAADGVLCANARWRP